MFFYWQGRKDMLLFYFALWQCIWSAFLFLDLLFCVPDVVDSIHILFRILDLRRYLLFHEQKERKKKSGQRRYIVRGREISYFLKEKENEEKTKQNKNKQNPSNIII